VIGGAGCGDSEGRMGLDIEDNGMYIAEIGGVGTAPVYA
jgi:hypothetical protein